MSELASSWAIHIAHAFWQATIAGAIILATVRLMPNAGPRLRHALVSLALVKFVLPPMLPLPTGLFSAAPAVPEIALVRRFAQSEFVIGLMLIHLAGVVVALAKLARGAWRVRRIEREAEPAEGFLLSDAVTVPATTGRAIIVPRALYARLTSAELAHVLEHEHEHQRRRDVRTGILQSLVAALWWFNPLVHALVEEARDLREERCDDAVVGRCRDRAGYARTLLEAAAFAGDAPTPAIAAIAGSEHTLLRRIRRMAAERYQPAPRPGLAAILLVLLAALILLPGLRVSASNRIAFDHATRHALHH